MLGRLSPLPAFFWWRFAATVRGGRRRDEAIMMAVDPLLKRCSDGADVSADEVARLAQTPQFRPVLYNMLKQFERLDLFPERYKTVESQAEAQLVYWMLHPNELQDAPSQIELVATCPREIANRKAEFLVFRYLMPENHWAGTDWLLGLSGPFFENDVPYSEAAGAFSRCGDKYGEVQSDALVDWYVDMAERKGLWRNLATES